MTKIFLSYRRSDSQHACDRIYEALIGRVPRRDVFIDVDNIPPGADFITHLDKRVGECDVLLALIGPQWLNATDPETGARRLDDPQDFVRIEVASALKRDIPVVPVLLDGAPMPSVGELPEALASLARRNAVEVRRSSFKSDVDRLIEGVAPRKSRKFAIISTLMIAIAVLVLGGGALAFYSQKGVDSAKSYDQTLSVQERTALWEKGLAAYGDRDYRRAFSAWSSACEAGEMLACANMGVQYQYGQGVAQDLARAVGLYDQACRSGEPQACTNLGALYGEGEGVSQDLARARDLYDRGCQGGVAEGCAAYGWYLVAGWGGDVDKHRGWTLLETACDEGSDYACGRISAVEKSGYIEGE